MNSCEELWAWIESYISKVSKNKRIQDRAELRAVQFRKLCFQLGSPQQKFRTIHIAGSKGKGQTASYIAHSLAALGLKVGLFSSPHIYSYNERIQVLQSKWENNIFVNKNIASSKQIRALHELPLQQGQLDSKAPKGRWQIESIDISGILQQQGGLLRDEFKQFCWAYDWDDSEGCFKNDSNAVESKEQGEPWCQLNFFAVLTLLAFRSFAAAGCDWIVLETGIGGRLCPTNAVIPELSVITAIELEHTDILGDRLELIAAEKAGIIKVGRPCVSAHQSPEVEAVLQKHSNSQKSALYLLQNCFKNFHTEKLHAIHLEEELDIPILQTFLQPYKLYFSMALDGFIRHSALELASYSSTQVDNIALALLSLQVLEQHNYLPAGEKIWETALEGLQYSRLPGRFALYWLNGCLLLFDGAHTPVSCQRLLNDMFSYLDCLNEDKKLSLLFAAVQGKDFAEMATILAPNFDEILLTRAGTFKENNLEKLEQAFCGALAESQDTRLLPSVENPVKALQTLLQGTPDLMVICGSFYLLGELLTNFHNI